MKRPISSSPDDGRPCPDGDLPPFLSGILPPLTTPFDERGELDLDALEHNVESYNRHDLRGYVAFGSNGEAAHLSADEQRRVLECVRRRAAPGRLLIAGVHQQSTRGALEAVERAADLGADAALVITPYFYRGAMDQETLKRFFLTVADGSRLPILIYLIPQNTGLTLTPSSVAELALHPRIAGLKDSSGNLGALCEVLGRVEEGFAVLAGNAGILYPALMMGAAGGILAVACVAPEPCVELFTAARGGDNAVARELQQRLAPLARCVTADFGVAGLKAALDLAGLSGGLPRQPLLPLTDAGRGEVERRMVESGFFGGSSREPGGVNFQGHV